MISFRHFNQSGAIWASVSAVIVTQTRLHPSIQASLLRIGANLIGAVMGALAGSLFDDKVVALAVGVFITGLTCHFGKMGDAVRPAFAAVVIVILSNEPRVWFGSLDRVLGVLVGCLVALIVGVVFDMTARLFNKTPGPERKIGDVSE
jgi:uncharacterized membrane protein YgaE (UPF0421/DUF939 family)